MTNREVTTIGGLERENPTGITVEPLRIVFWSGYRWKEGKVTYGFPGTTLFWETYNTLLETVPKLLASQNLEPTLITNFPVPIDLLLDRLQQLKSQGRSAISIVDVTREFAFTEHWNKVNAPKRWR